MPNRGFLILGSVLQGPACLLNLLFSSPRNVLLHPHGATFSREFSMYFMPPCLCPHFYSLPGASLPLLESIFISHRYASKSNPSGLSVSQEGLIRFSFVSCIYIFDQIALTNVFEFIYFP